MILHDYLAALKIPVPIVSPMAIGAATVQALKVAAPTTVLPPTKIVWIAPGTNGVHQTAGAKLAAATDDAAIPVPAPVKAPSTKEPPTFSKVQDSL